MYFKGFEFRNAYGKENYFNSIDKSENVNDRRLVDYPLWNRNVSIKSDFYNNGAFPSVNHYSSHMSSGCMSSYDNYNIGAPCGQLSFGKSSLRAILRCKDGKLIFDRQDVDCHKEKILHKDHFYIFELILAGCECGMVYRITIEQKQSN